MTSFLKGIYKDYIDAQSQISSQLSFAKEICMSEHERVADQISRVTSSIGSAELLSNAIGETCISAKDALALMAESQLADAHRATSTMALMAESQLADAHRATSTMALMAESQLADAHRATSTMALMAESQLTDAHKTKSTLASMAESQLGDVHRATSTLASMLESQFADAYSNVSTQTSMMESQLQELTDASLSSVFHADFTSEISNNIEKLQARIFDLQPNIYENSLVLSSFVNELHKSTFSLKYDVEKLQKLIDPFSDDFNDYLLSGKINEERISEKDNAERIKFYSKLKEFLSIVFTLWDTSKKLKGDIQNVLFWLGLSYLISENSGCSRLQMEKSHEINKLFENKESQFVYNQPNLKNNPVARIPKGSSVEIIEEKDISYKVGFYDEMGKHHIGYIKKTVH